MDKKLYKYLIITVAVIILLSITIFLFSKTKEPENNQTIQNEENIIKDKSVDAKTFYSLEETLQKYVEAISNKQNEVVYNMISDNYIKENNIDKNNIEEHFTNMKNAEKIWVLDIEKLEDNNISMQYFAVKALITNSSIKLEEEVFFEVCVDQERDTFCITPSKVEKLEEIVISSEYELIENNNNNKYKKAVVNDQYIINRYLQYYRYNTICNIEKAYEIIEKKYREARFPTIDDYKKHMEENPLEGLPEIIKYSKEEKEGYTRYICLDLSGKYYIMEEYKTMNYNIMLDDYTVDLPEFLEKYSSVNEAGKVVLNIQKFISSINNSDYKYAYNCLNQDFKNNKYKTLEEFKKFIKDKLFEDIIVEYNNFSSQGNIYTYNITLYDKLGLTPESVKMNIIMKLKEGTKFEMSFSII